MKGMSIGNKGFIPIFKALVGDRIIQQIVLPGSGISLEAVRQLAETLPTMKSINVLDLSQCALCDECARLLAEAIIATPTLVKLTVAANRITVAGAMIIVKAVLDERCSLSFFSICNNHIRPAEREVLIALAHPFHVSGQQSIFRPTYFDAPGGRKTVYPFAFTPFKKKAAIGSTKEKLLPVDAQHGQASPEPGLKTISSILSTSPTRERKVVSLEVPSETFATRKGVTFDDAPASPTGLEKSFDDFVYRGQGAEGMVGSASFRGLHIYL